MKKITYIIILGLIVLPLISMFFVGLATAQSDSGLTPKPIMPPGQCLQLMKQGSSGDKVKELQEILKTDPTIYPEGMVTGYFGPLTGNAVTRLQARYNLPPSGAIDESTSQVIWPCPTDFELVVLSPNGGEVWDRKDVHKITWKLLIGQTDAQPGDINHWYFYHRANITLIDDDNFIFYNLANVDISQGSYSWAIDPSIPNGSNYKIRIGIGSPFVCKAGTPCPMPANYLQDSIDGPSLMPTYYLQDTSVATFTITGTVPPTPSPTPIPGQITKAISMLEEIMAKLNDIIAMLKSI